MMRARSLSQLIKSFTQHLCPFTQYKHAKTRTIILPVSEREEDAMKGQKNAVIAQKKLVPETMKKKKADASVSKKEKASSKLSGAPKRPPTAFFVFMDEFRKEYKENFPDNKSIAAVAKSGGEKWKSMSDSEKAPYVEIAGKKKAEYVTAMKQFNDNSNLTGAEKSVDSGKSSSEVHDDAEQEASS